LMFFVFNSSSFKIDNLLFNHPHKGHIAKPI